MPRVFRRGHDAFAELLFRFLSDYKEPKKGIASLDASFNAVSDDEDGGEKLDNLSKLRVNYEQFLQKLYCLFPKQHYYDKI